jgi:hypothetical protein
MTDLSWPTKYDDWRGDGIVSHRDHEYRVHKAWTTVPNVFVRYVSRGKHVERKLPRFSNISVNVIDKFRNEVRQEQSH